jgi:hypothetical protein
MMMRRTTTTRKARMLMMKSDPLGSLVCFFSLFGVTMPKGEKFFFFDRKTVGEAPTGISLIKHRALHEKVRTPFYKILKKEKLDCIYKTENGFYQVLRNPKP